MKKIGINNKVSVVIGLFGGIIIGLILGYMIATYSVVEVVANLQIENMVIDLNETIMMEWAYEHIQ